MNKPDNQAAQIFSRFPEIAAGITLRAGTEPAYQDNNYAFRPLQDTLVPAELAQLQAVVLTKRAQLGPELLAATATTHFIHQIHSDQVILAKETTSAGETDADAVISTQPDQMLAVSIADCAGVLLYDPTVGVLAAVHSGWRGTKADITTKTIQRMATLGAQPANLWAYVSPTACPKHYEVGEEFAGFFDAAFLPRHNGKLGFDNQAAILHQLTQAGVPPEHVAVDKHCTIEESRLHSYRRNGKLSGRFVAYIGRRN